MLDFFKKDKSKPIKTAAIIVAAGQSSRMNCENKQFIDILGKPALTYSLEAFQSSPSIDEIYVVAREQDILFISDIVNTYGITKTVSIVAGGKTRTESVKCGIDAAGGCDFFCNSRRRAPLHSAGAHRAHGIRRPKLRCRGSRLQGI